MKIQRAMMITVAMMVAVLTANGSTKHWTAAAAGSWSTAANWQENAVPSDSDDIVIDSASSISAMPSTPPIIHDLSCNTALNFNSYTCKFRLQGDLTLLGGNFAFQWGGFTLEEGQHVIDTGAYGMTTRDMRIDGTGGLTKRGSGSIYPSSATTSPHNLSFSGPLIIEGGVFGTRAKNTKISGTTNITISGATSILALDAAGVAVNSNATITISDGGRIRICAGNTNVVKALVVNGMPCAAGTWGAWDNGNVQYFLKTEITGAGVILVREGPQEGAYTGNAESDLTSGVTRHWVGAEGGGDGMTWTSALNWDELEGVRSVPGDFDDIVIDTAITSALQIPSAAPIIRNLTLNNSVVGSYSNPFRLIGDMALNASMNWNWSSFTLERGTHVIHIASGCKLYGHDLRIYGNCNAGLTKRGAGSILATTTTRSGTFSFVGPLHIEEGLVDLQQTTFQIAALDIAMTGVDAQLKMAGPAMNTKTTLRLSDSGALNLNGDFEQNVWEYYRNGVIMSAKTYGSTSSPAEKTDDVHFIGNGVISVAHGGPQGTLMFYR